MNISDPVEMMDWSNSDDETIDMDVDDMDSDAMDIGMDIKWVPIVWVNLVWGQKWRETVVAIYCRILYILTL